MWSGPLNPKLSWYINNTDIVTILMETSIFPQNFKEAHVRPLLEKYLFQKQTEKLQTCILSRILEKVEANRLQAYIK